jgi:hypothetical protein
MSLSLRNKLLKVTLQRISYQKLQLVKNLGYMTFQNLNINGILQLQLLNQEMMFI